MYKHQVNLESQSLRHRVRQPTVLTVQVHHLGPCYPSFSPVRLERFVSMSAYPLLGVKLMKNSHKRN
jgi:hypothetical protein